MHKQFMHIVMALTLTLGGVVSATAQELPPESAFLLKSTLSGAQEVTLPTTSTLTGGEVTLEFDAGFSQAEAILTLEGDATTVTGVHLHCARPGVDGPVFLGLVGPGTCDMTQLAAGTLTCTLTNANINPAADCLGTVARPVTNIAALFFAAQDGLVYMNVHTTANSGGELRGQLVETDILETPELPPQ